MHLSTFMAHQYQDCLQDMLRAWILFHEEELTEFARAAGMEADDIVFSGMELMETRLKDGWGTTVYVRMDVMADIQFLHTESGWLYENGTPVLETSLPFALTGTIDLACGLERMILTQIYPLFDHGYAPDYPDCLFHTPSRQETEEMARQLLEICAPDLAEKGETLCPEQAAEKLGLRPVFCDDGSSVCVGTQTDSAEPVLFHDLLILRDRRRSLLQGVKIVEECIRWKLFSRACMLREECERLDISLEGIFPDEAFPDPEAWIRQIAETTARCMLMPEAACRKMAMETLERLADVQESVRTDLCIRSMAACFQVPVWVAALRWQDLMGQQIPGIPLPASGSFPAIHCPA